MARTLRIALIVFELFVGLNALGGGIALVAGFSGMSEEALRGSPFTSYVVPGIALIVFVGGSDFLAAALLLARRRAGIAASALAGLILVIFEIVEATVIGITSVLQPALTVAGLLIVVLAVGLLVSREAL